MRLISRRGSLGGIIHYPTPSNRLPSSWRKFSYGDGPEPALLRPGDIERDMTLLWWSQAFDRFPALDWMEAAGTAAKVSRWLDDLASGWP